MPGVEFPLADKANIEQIIDVGIWSHCWQQYTKSQGKKMSTIRFAEERGRKLLITKLVFLKLNAI